MPSKSALRGKGQSPSAALEGVGGPLVGFGSEAMLSMGSPVPPYQTVGGGGAPLRRVTIGPDDQGRAPNRPSPLGGGGGIGAGGGNASPLSAVVGSPLSKTGSLRYQVRGRAIMLSLRPYGWRWLRPCYSLIAGA